MQLQGIILGIVTILIWGVTFVNTKVLLNDFNSFEILFLRFAAAYAARFAKGWNLFHLGFLGVFASAVAFSLWNKTCALLGTVRATCGIYFIPAVTAVVAYFVLGESLTAMTGLGAILTILGVVICG